MTSDMFCDTELASYVPQQDCDKFYRIERLGLGFVRDSRNLNIHRSSIPGKDGTKNNKYSVSKRCNTFLCNFLILLITLIWCPQVFVALYLSIGVLFYTFNNYQNIALFIISKFSSNFKRSQRITSKQPITYLKVNLGYVFSITDQMDQSKNGSDRSKVI